jgi:tRNA U34 5-methylaminomethyl-2-thiouridine-forming methyltransferase MnmC
MYGTDSTYTQTSDSIELKRKIITTSDGSKTIQIEDWNEQYHSVHGAIQEAEHVFIQHGFLFYSDRVLNAINKTIDILEIGFGTGLNAYLTLIRTEDRKQNVNYKGVEGFPVMIEEIKQLNYTELTSYAFSDAFMKMHSIPWNARYAISDHFILEKQHKLFDEIQGHEDFDLIYFDAFGARVQPELWTEKIFGITYKVLRPGGVLVTYSAKGSVRRAMEAVGFKVERLPGPPGKREMLRARKIFHI